MYVHSILKNQYFCSPMFLISFKKKQLFTFLFIVRWYMFTEWNTHDIKGDLLEKFQIPDNSSFWCIFFEVHFFAYRVTYIYKNVMMCIL